MKFPDPPGERLADFRLLPRYDFFARGVVFDHLSVVALRREIPADLLQVVIAGTMNFRTMDQYHRWMRLLRVGCTGVHFDRLATGRVLALGPGGAGRNGANQKRDGDREEPELIDRFDSVSHVEFRLTLPSTSADLQVAAGRGTTWRDNDAVADRREYLRDRHESRVESSGAFTATPGLDIYRKLPTVP